MSDVFLGAFVSLVAAFAVRLFATLAVKGSAIIRMVVGCFFGSGVFFCVWAAWRWSIGLHT